MIQGEYITAAEYAEIHNMPIANVRDWIRRGKLPAEKISGVWLIRKDAEALPDRRIKSGKYIDWRKK